MKELTTKGWKRSDFVRFYMDVWQCPVVPVAETKRPMVKWTEYNPAKGGRMPTEQELKDWFDKPCRAFKQPPWGVAIILQGNLFSIDFDTDELFTDFKERGAFPTGACIYKSAKGYHVVMRSRNIVPYTVKEHNPVLIALNEDFDELGIGGDNNHLSNMPDTPGRQWLALYDQPVLVDYEAWLAKYVGWTKEEPYKQGAGWQDEIMCPWHEWGGTRDDGTPHEPSLRCNIDTGGFECHGCSEHGTFTKLVKKATEVGMPLPGYVQEWLNKFHDRANVGAMVDVAPSSVPQGHSPTATSEEVDFGDLPAGLVDGVIWRGDVGIIFAPAGAGKSSVSNSAAGDIVLGRELWGMDGWQPQKDLKVLLLDIENRPGETRAAIRRATDKDENLRNLFVDELTGLGFDIYNQEWLDYLKEQLTKLGIDILIIDNLNTYTSSNLNDPFEMKKVVSINRRLAQTFNIAIVAIHHTGHLKTGEDGEYIDVRPTGGAGIRNDANFEFQVLRIKSKKNQVRVTCTKIRSRVSKVHVGDEIALRYDEETTRMSPVGNEYLRAQLNLVVKKFGNNRAATLLNVAGPTLSNWVHGVREPKGEYKKAIEDLCKKEGLVPRAADL